jgi:3-phytase
MDRLLKMLALGLAIVTGLSVASAAKAEAPFSKIVIFGDSLSDTGNAYLASSGVIAGFPYYQGRFSNGPVWVEIMAQELGLPAPAASLDGGTNYAWGGAETGPGLSYFDTPNVGMQIDMFLADHGGFAGDELIVVAAGSNDLLWQPPWGYGQIVGNLCNHITDLAAVGGKTFLVANTPISPKFNNLLEKQLIKLEVKLGVDVRRLDMAGLQAAVLLNPSEYGLTNVTDPACPGCGIGIPDPDAANTLVPNPDEYFFWDFIHWTRVVHAIIGQSAAYVVNP